MKRGLPRRWGITDRIKCIGGLPLTPPSSCCGWSHPESIELKADMTNLLSGRYRDHILVGALVEAHLILEKKGFGERESGKSQKAFVIKRILHKTGMVLGTIWLDIADIASAQLCNLTSKLRRAALWKLNQPLWPWRNCRLCEFQIGQASCCR